VCIQTAQKYRPYELIFTCILFTPSRMGHSLAVDHKRHLLLLLFSSVPLIYLCSVLTLDYVQSVAGYIAIAEPRLAHRPDHFWTDIYR